MCTKKLFWKCIPIYQFLSMKSKVRIFLLQVRFDIRLQSQTYRSMQEIQVYCDWFLTMNIVHVFKLSSFLPRCHKNSFTFNSIALLLFVLEIISFTTPLSEFWRERKYEMIRNEVCIPLCNNNTITVRKISYRIYMWLFK